LRLDALRVREQRRPRMARELGPTSSSESSTSRSLRLRLEADHGRAGPPEVGRARACRARKRERLARATIANLARVYRKLGIHSHAELGAQASTETGVETGVM
jgi:hypothetical protein